MNKIHETAFIGPNVSLGSNNYIGPYCYITGNTTIGDNNRFEAHCSVGTPAEHKDYFTNQNTLTIIGDNNIFREFITIHSGTKSSTILENDIIVLNHSHIAHDSYIENKTTISANVTLAGHCHVMEGANLAVGSMCHQFQIIGAYAMLGMGSVVTKTSLIEPGNIYIGSPAKFLKINNVGLERNNINDKKLLELINKYHKLRNEL